MNVLLFECSMLNRRLTALAGLISVLIFAPAVMLAQQPRSLDTPPQPGQLALPVEPATKLPGTVSAVPFTIRNKFDYRVVQSFGWRGVLGSALSAGVGQLANTPHEWGQGAEGYGLRYGSSFGGDLSRQTFAWALESALHEDPRYFPSEDKQHRKQRLINALRQAFLTKTDSGRDEFAYARYISAFGAGQFMNIWLPRSDRSVADGLERGCISIGADAAYNILQEFFPFTRPVSFRTRKPSAPTTNP